MIFSDFGVILWMISLMTYAFWEGDGGDGFDEIP